MADIFVEYNLGESMIKRFVQSSTVFAHLPLNIQIEDFDF